MEDSVPSKHYENDGSGNQKENGWGNPVIGKKKRYQKSRNQ